MKLPPFDGPVQRPRQAETSVLAPDEAYAGIGREGGAGGSPLAGSGTGAAGGPVAGGGTGAGGWPSPREPEPAERTAAPPPAMSPMSPMSPISPATPPRRAPSGDEPEPLNLSRRPFVNTRPVARVAAILWLLGLALLAANLALFQGYLTKSQTTRAKLAEMENETDREKRGVAALQGSIGSLKLDQQNRLVAFLNRKIDERTFSWSLLFDRMAEVLPQRVRLLQLTPANVVQKEAATALPRPGGRDKQVPVTLTMSCEAKDDEAVLQFVDNLFAHPAFADPNLLQEDRDESGLVRFSLIVQYQPNLPAAEVVATRPAPVRTRPAAPRRRGGGATSALSGPAAAGASPAAPDTASGAAAAAPAPVPPPASPAGAGLVRVAPVPELAPRPGGTRSPSTTRRRPTPRPIPGGAGAGRAATPTGGTGGARP